MEQRLHKSSKEKVIWGVCGGLAEFFAVDPVLVRVVFAALTLASGVGIVAYIILAIAMPDAPKKDDPLVSGMPDDPVDAGAAPASAPATGEPAPGEKERRGAVLSLIHI